VSDIIFRFGNIRPKLESAMGWKTPKFEYVNGYKIAELEGPVFQVFDGDRQLGEPFPYSGEAVAYANSLLKREQHRDQAGSLPKPE
jgi:hypothetical protein